MSNVPLWGGGGGITKPKSEAAATSYIIRQQTTTRIPVSQRFYFKFYFFFRQTQEIIKSCFLFSFLSSKCPSCKSLPINVFISLPSFRFVLALFYSFSLEALNHCSMQLFSVWLRSCGSNSNILEIYSECKFLLH